MKNSSAARPVALGFGTRIGRQGTRIGIEFGTRIGFAFGTRIGIEYGTRIGRESED